MHASASAVRELRERLKETQQAFANHVGLSISAVTNYEAGRGPTGRSLVALHRVARESGHMDLARTFRATLHEELGLGEIAENAIGDAVTAASLANSWMARLDAELCATEIPAEARRALEKAKRYIGETSTSLEAVNPLLLSPETK